jgi:hypothetical protein
MPIFEERVAAPKPEARWRQGEILVTRTHATVRAAEARIARSLHLLDAAQRHLTTDAALPAAPVQDVFPDPDPRGAAS